MFVFWFLVYRFLKYIIQLFMKFGTWFSLGSIILVFSLVQIIIFTLIQLFEADNEVSYPKRKGL